MVRKSNNLLNLLLATRVYRVIPTLLIILIPINLTNNINIDIIILSICATLIYSSNGIQNAINDKDYSLPKKTNIFSYSLILIAIILSLYDPIILLTVITAISFGLIYNTISRKIILTDTSILSITHFFLPALSASLLLELDINTSLKLATTLFFTAFFLMPVKNIKDKKEDKKRKYKTLVTEFKSGEKITLILFALTLIPLFFAKFILNLNNIYWIFFLLFIIIEYTIIKLIIQNKTKQGINLCRLLIMLFLVSIIISTRINTIPILVSGIFLVIYLIKLNIKSK